MAILYKDIEILSVLRFQSKMSGCKNVNNIEIHTKFSNKEAKKNR